MAARGWYGQARPQQLPLVVGKDENHGWIQCSYRRHACAWPAKRTHFWPTRRVPLEPCQSTQFSVMGVEGEELLVGDNLSALHSFSQCVSEDHLCLCLCKTCGFQPGLWIDALELSGQPYKVWQHLLFFTGNSGWFILSPKKQEWQERRFFPYNLCNLNVQWIFIFLSMTNWMFLVY